MTVDGRFAPSHSPEAYIPLDEYEFEAISDLFGVAGVLKILAVPWKHIHPDDDARDDRHEIGSDVAVSQKGGRRQSLVGCATAEPSESLLHEEA